MNKISNVLCCNNPIPWELEDFEDFPDLEDGLSRSAGQTNNTRKTIWEEQPIFKYIREKKLGLVCLLHLLGANCEINEATEESALTILSQKIDNDEINIDLFTDFVKWYCIKILGLYQNSVCHKYFKCANDLLSFGVDIDSAVNQN